MGIDEKFTGAMHKHGGKLCKLETDKARDRMRGRLEHIAELHENASAGMFVVAKATLSENKTMELQFLTFCPGCLKQAATQFRELADEMDALSDLEGELIEKPEQ